MLRTLMHADAFVADTGLERLAPTLKSTLKPEEWRKVAHVLARGGRFQPAEQAYQGELMGARFPKALQIYSETVGTSRSSTTGKRFAGVPQWTPPAFADCTEMRTRYPSGPWPMLLCSQKSVLMNSYGIGIDRLRGIHVDNPVAINVADAAKLGVRNGGKVRVTTPGGSFVGTALVRQGVMPGVVSVEHGYGHKELGARAHRISSAAHRIARRPTISGPSRRTSAPPACRRRA